MYNKGTKHGVRVDLALRNRVSCQIRFAELRATPASQVLFHHDNAIVSTKNMRSLPFSMAAKLIELSSEKEELKKIWLRWQFVKPGQGG